jgi:thiol-disulfide isomerase/thioredoxin
MKCSPASRSAKPAAPHSVAPSSEFRSSAIINLHPRQTESICELDSRHMKKRLALLFVCLAASFCLPGFGAPAQSNSAGVASSTEVREINLDGLRKILQRDPKDARPLLVNFWATWCDPCREEFPDLVKVDSDYRSKGLNFVAVSLDDIGDIKTAVPKFLTEMKATMPVVLLNVSDPEPAIKAVDDKWDGELPATFLYDKSGRVVFKHFGRIQAAELRTAIDKVMTDK